MFRRKLIKETCSDTRTATFVPVRLIHTVTPASVWASSTSSLHNDMNNSGYYYLSQRFRKKPPRTYWQRMWNGQNPYGPPKGKTETSEERAQREERLLNNRRNRGRLFMDWIYMPHLQHMIYLDPKFEHYYQNMHLSPEKIDSNYEKFINSQRENDDTNDNNENNESNENSEKNENENENELKEWFDYEFNYDYTENSHLGEKEIGINPYDEKKVLQYLNNDDEYRNTNKTIRMMRDTWKIYPESCFWTVVRVEPSFRYPKYINPHLPSHLLDKHENINPYFGKIVRARAYGRLTWRNEEQTEIKPIPETKKRGWTWIPCQNWIQHDPTKQNDFTPLIRRYGKFAYL